MTTRKLKLRQARATQEEIDNLVEFLRMIDEVLTCRTYTYTIDGEEVTEEVNPERFQEIIEQLWTGDWINRESGVGNSWHRIVFGYITLFDNACDPNVDFLEWKPEIAEFLSKQSDNNQS
jgi:hypothetical protein